MSEEIVDKNAILQSLENYEEKHSQTLEVIEMLISVYVQASDDNNVRKFEDELAVVSSEASKDIASVKAFLSMTLKRPEEDSLSDGLDKSEMRRSFRSETKMLPEGSGRKMQPINIPKFNGDKTTFEYFWAAFTTIIDESNEKYKMIRLKSCLEGKAADAIEKLGYSDVAYEEAKKTLQRKFGGRRRQIQNYLDIMRNITPLQKANIEDFDKFTDHLVNTIVMLKEQKLWNELEPNSMLFTLMLEKLPRSTLSRYFRWVSERRAENDWNR